MNYIQLNPTPVRGINGVSVRAIKVHVKNHLSTLEKHNECDLELEAV